MSAVARSLGDVIAAARPFGHGAPCDAALLDVLDRAVAGRGAPGDPSPPRVSHLEVRRDGLPAWWTQGDNLLLAAPDAELLLHNGFGLHPTRGNVAVLGVGVHARNVAFPNTDALIVIGDGARLAYVDISASRGGTVLIGEDTTSGLHARVDGRNGGAVVIGADGMWSSQVNLVTDDMHAIRDVADGRRINSFGGRIVVERHVWLCERSRVTGGARIGADTVVGLSSVVGKTTLPPNSVCVGAPCKPIRTGTTWTREDLP